MSAAARQEKLRVRRLALMGLSIVCTYFILKVIMIEMALELFLFNLRTLYSDIAYMLVQTAFCLVSPLLLVHHTLQSPFVRTYV